MNFLTDALAHLPPPAVYALLAAVVCAESVLLLGAFTPTLALLLTSGAMARAGSVSLPLVIAAAAAAAVAGDYLAHRTGGVLGGRLRAGGVGRRVPAAAWQRAETLMARHAGRAVFLSRFVPVVRTLTPHLAGATRLPYRAIAPYSASAAGLWAAAEAGIGYAAATSLERLLTLGGPALAVVAVTAVAGAVLWAGRRG
ncbi:VTT domain-containing protein [Kitasatospora sp. NPDC002551]|uniref:DedA family protein n=1 Tax=unclassified Kitasatospora TaxID=2633591 RepID=UPI00332ADA4A